MKQDKISFLIRRQFKLEDKWSIVQGIIVINQEIEIQVKKDIIISKVRENKSLSLC